MNLNTLSMPSKERPTNKSLMENVYHHDLIKTKFYKSKHVENKDDCLIIQRH